MNIPHVENVFMVSAAYLVGAAVEWLAGDTERICEPFRIFHIAAGGCLVVMLVVLVIRGWR